MSPESRNKHLAQIAFNLLLILLLVIALLAVIREILSPDGDLQEGLLLLVLLVAVLFIGIGFLIRLIRSTREP